MTPDFITVHINSMTRESYKSIASVADSPVYKQLMLGNVGFIENEGLDSYIKSLRIDEYPFNCNVKKLSVTLRDLILASVTHFNLDKQIALQGFTAGLLLRNNMENRLTFQVIEWAAALIKLAKENLKSFQSTQIDIPALVNSSVSQAYFLLVYTLYQEILTKHGGTFFHEAEVRQLAERFDKHEKVAQALSSSGIPVTFKPILRSNPIALLATGTGLGDAAMYITQNQMQQNHDPLVSVFVHVNNGFGQAVTQQRVMTYSEFVAGIQNGTIPHQQPTFVQQQQQQHFGFQQPALQHHGLNPVNLGLGNIDFGQQQVNNYGNSTAGSLNSSTGWAGNVPEFIEKKNDMYVPPAVAGAATEVADTYTASEVKETLYSRSKLLAADKYWFNPTTVIAAATDVHPSKASNVRTVGAWNRVVDVMLYDFEDDYNSPKIIYLSRSKLGVSMDLDDVSFRHPARPTAVFAPGMGEIDTLTEIKNRTGLDYSNYIKEVIDDVVVDLMENEMISLGEDGDDETTKTDVINVNISEIPTSFSLAHSRIEAIASAEEAGLDISKPLIYIGAVAEAFVSDAPVTKVIEEVSTHVEDASSLACVSLINGLLVNKVPVFYEEFHKRLVKETNHFLENRCGVNTARFFVVNWETDVFENSYLSLLEEKGFAAKGTTTKYRKHILSWIKSELNFAIGYIERNLVLCSIGSFIDESNMGSIKDHVVLKTTPSVTIESHVKASTIELMSVSLTNENLYTVGPSNQRLFAMLTKLHSCYETASKSMSGISPIMRLVTKEGKFYRVDKSDGEVFHLEPIV